MHDGSPNIEVRQTGSKGLGIFALVTLTAGAAVIKMTYVREITNETPLCPELGEREDHCDYPDGRMMLVAEPACYFNHSCDPNAYVDETAAQAVVRARRPIASGEEVTIDYLINVAGGSSWPCHCGERRCRGKTGKSFFDLPAEIRAEYAPLLAPWFRRRHAERLASLMP
jgi:hypothetical protein